MKGLSYLALVLSIIALALGIYAFAGGFGGAGTALVATPTSTSTSSTSAVATFPTGLTQLAGSIGVVTADISKPITVNLKNKAGVTLATYSFQRVASVVSGVARFIGLYQVNIVVPSGAAAALSPVVANAGTAPVSSAPAATRDAYLKKVAASMAINFDVAAFVRDLKAAAAARPGDVLTLYGTGLTKNAPLVLSTSATVVSGTSDGSTQQYLLEAGELGGGGCDSGGGCGSGQGT